MKQRTTTKKAPQSRAKARRGVKTKKPANPTLKGAALIRPDTNTSVLKAIGRDKLVVKAGTVFGSHKFTKDTPVPLHLNAAGKPGYMPGEDYAVHFDGKALTVVISLGIPSGDTLLGGFHYAPGGNAMAQSGGDNIPAINPCSLWDIGFRPTCPDPRGMTLVDMFGERFWCDTYLTGVDHLDNGTSKFGATIADGNDQPICAHGQKAPRFDYATAQSVMTAHGKKLLSVTEFFAATYGVTEKTSAKCDPKTTGLDAPRTSRFGVMQATGNMWVWGHDGHPNVPRASIFGGSWIYDECAGSRCAYLGRWPGTSHVYLGARGRSDHLQLV